jgi:hypothetical protein
MDNQKENEEEFPVESTILANANRAAAYWHDRAHEAEKILDAAQDLMDVVGDEMPWLADQYPEVGEAWAKLHSFADMEHGLLPGVKGAA